MKPADRVVPLLHGVRRTGNSEWVAKCPAHDDRSPSMAVRETDDGRLLMHCFAGCEIGSMLAALGLRVGDLFPAPLEHRKGALRHPFSPGAVLKAIRGEAMIVLVAGNAAQRGELSAADCERLAKAVGRIQEAVGYA